MAEKKFGFALQSVRELPELNARFHEMEHEKTGARLVWLERAEENKTFGIAFQTQPWDDTGVFHILEHSVLCGSDRYPVKEPFVELMKSSLNTFLNAMTFPDKTFYPVSSRNEQDFINLMRVYMDAVLHPQIHAKPEIFYQEGWHYELAEKVFALLCQRRAMLTEQAAMAGHMVSMNRVLACDAAEGVVREHTGGIVYLQWLKALEDDFQNAFPALAESLEQLAGTVFTRARLTLSVTGMSGDAAEKAAGLLAETLPVGGFTLPAGPAVRPWGRRREGVVIPVDVSFAAMGGAIRTENLGAAKVMGRIVSLAYLWNAVRVQGGAYGVGMGVRDNGTVGFYSFRDPSANRTLGCYRQSGDFLAGAGEMDLTGMILGAIAESDPLMTARMKGATADVRYWRGVTHDDLRRVRHEMLSARPGDLAALAEALRLATADGSVCVLGSRRQIEDCAGELETVFAL